MFPKNGGLIGHARKRLSRWNSVATSHRANDGVQPRASHPSTSETIISRFHIHRTSTNHITRTSAAEILLCGMRSPLPKLLVVYFPMNLVSWSLASIEAPNG